MISYIGGKGRIGKWIEPHIPKDIETYVEPFGGMFWVFFKLDLKKYSKLKTVVYNDYNQLNANLFKCAVEYEKLLDEMSKYECQQLDVVDTDPKFKEMFDSCQKEVFDPNFDVGVEPNFDAAAKYLYVLTHVFSGSKPERATFTDYKGKYRSKFLIFTDKLRNPKYREHFDKITFVENLDFTDVIKKYDSPTTYFYLDPPYWKTENYYSNHDFDVDDHIRLAQLITAIEGQFSLSYYEFPQLLNWFPKDEYVWRTKQFKKAASAKKDGTQNMGTELLIMNYDPPIIDAVEVLSDILTEEVSKIEPISPESPLENNYKSSPIPVQEPLEQIIQKEKIMENQIEPTISDKIQELSHITYETLFGINSLLANSEETKRTIIRTALIAICNECREKK